jgi:hypothetical protein
MIKTYQAKATSRKRDVGRIIVLAILLLLFALVFEARAQEGGQGNTTIFGGAKMALAQKYIT